MFMRSDDLWSQACGQSGGLAAICEIIDSYTRNSRG